MIWLLRIPIDRKPSKDKLIIQITQYMKKLTKNMSQETKIKIKIEKMSEQEEIFQQAIQNSVRRKMDSMKETFKHIGDKMKRSKPNQQKLKGALKCGRGSF